MRSSLSVTVAVWLLGVGALYVATRTATCAESRAVDDVSVTMPKDGTTDVEIDAQRGELGNVAILKDRLPGLDDSTVDHLAGALRADGFGVTTISANSATDSHVLSPENFRLYVIPNAQVYPADGIPALLSYLQRRGNAIILGAPAFSRPVWPYKGEWIDMGTIRERIAGIKPERVLVDFADRNPATWTRSSNNFNAPGTIQTVDGGPEGTGKCLKMWSGEFTGWDTYGSPVIREMFPESHSLLCFWAKGDAATPEMSVEINEDDGSRWIAVVSLSPEWTYQVLTPDEFQYWPDAKTRKKRGTSGDRLNVAAAVKIRFGLAHSHTRKVRDGSHTFWIDDIGTAPNPFAEFLDGATSENPLIETVSPPYKVYPLQDIGSLRANPQQVLIKDAERLPVPAAAFSSITRPNGKGFGFPRKWRWIPLLDANGSRRGSPFWMLIQRSPPFGGAITAAMAVNDPAFMKDEDVTAALVEVARRICNGVFFEEAGSTKFSCWPDETVKLGASIVNTGTKSASTTVRISVTAKCGGPPVFSESFQVTVATNDTAKVETSWKPSRFDCDIYAVTSELLEGDRAADVITHELGILATGKASPDEFVTVKGSDFYLRGRKWYPVGVNFWPLYVSGSEPADYNLGWLAPGFYAPEETERDLKRMAALGINMVSIQLGPRENIPNLLDFLRRCRKHDIKVNGYLGLASPLDFDENELNEFIKEARLSENPVLFAYDTIWEPGNYVFRQDWRKRWDSDWSAWLVERYGSIANAEEDWGVAAPRTPDGKITSPADNQFKEDGKWRVLMAAYRRFMDDLASCKWNKAHRKLREIDPNHLVSFRQGNTLPHDFTFTATPKHIDFICPEGYSIQLGEDGYNAAGFITRYVNFTTRGKPIIWSEFGKSIWDQQDMRPDPHAERYQTDYHDMFYRMAIQSGANGTVPWWWPGGYRVGERSDYGVCNPDGSPRPAALLIKKYASCLKKRREFPKPTEWITIDRDAHPGGYWYIAFNTGKDAYAKAVANGKDLGIRTEGTGTTSVTAPLVGVGNKPYNGSNPLKFLNAEFNWLKIKNAEGVWVEAIDGAEISVKANDPILATVSVGNTQEATWLTPNSAGDKRGAVYIASTANSVLNVKQPIPSDTPYLSDADFGEITLAPGVSEHTKVELQMTAEDRAWFGEKRTFLLIPRVQRKQD